MNSAAQAVHTTRDKTSGRVDVRSSRRRTADPTGRLDIALADTGALLLNMLGTHLQLTGPPLGTQLRPKLGAISSQLVGTKRVINRKAIAQLLGGAA